MSYPVNASGVADIDGVVWGWRWASNQANGHTELTYCFPSSPTGYGYDGIGGFSPFTAAQREAGLKALALYDSYCNLDFVFTADTAAGNIRMAEADWIDVGYGYGEYPIGTAFGWAPDPNFSPPVCQGDTWFNHDFYENPAAGSFAFFCGILWRAARSPMRSSSRATFTAISRTPSAARATTASPATSSRTRSPAWPATTG